MSDADARRWAEMAGSGDATATTTFGAPPVPPESAAAPAEAPMPARDQGKKAKKDKEPRRERRPKPPKVPSASRSRLSSPDDVPLLDMGRETRSREQLMQAGAEDLMAALSGSYTLLHAEVPDSSSPDDAQRKIEAQLAKYDPDNDAEIPAHPIYEGDALVYYQLRRHYGLPHPGNTQGRAGGLLRRSDRIQRGFTAADEWGNRRR